MHYRSGLMFRSPLALGGHEYGTLSAAFAGGDDLLSGPEVPAIYQCVKCYLIRPGYLIREGFVPRPCMGGVAALKEAR